MYDVILVGLGGMGSAAACELARRGKRVLGLERHARGHDRGSSHGGSRLIRQAYFEDPAYVPLVLRAYELWERLERETNKDLMTLCGGLMLGQRGSRVLEGSLLSAREHDLPCEVIEAEELRRRFPALAPTRETVALYEASAGFIDPGAAIDAQLDRAANHGAELHFEEPVSRGRPQTRGTVSGWRRRRPTTRRSGWFSRPAPGPRRCSRRWASP